MANLKHAEDDPKHAKVSGGLPEAVCRVQPAEGLSADAVSCAVPSFAAASALLSAPYSCLVMNTHRRHVALPPMYLKKKRSGIREELEAELLKFSPRLNGVPLAYDNITIVDQQGHIYDDSGYIHMDIQATFIVFQPEKGHKLLGRVNKLGASHVGCLVHGCFNASIPKPNLVSVDTWRVAGPRIGAELEFEVTALDADTAGVLLIRGRLERTRVQELMAMGESSESVLAADEPDAPDPDPAPEQTEEPPDDTPKKKKKKKKDKVKEEETDIEIAALCQEHGDAPDEVNGNEAVREKKKKKKEKRVKEEEREMEIEVSPMEVHGSDSSGYVSDKPSKKRKHQSGSDATSGFSEEPEPPKSKKKRKSNA
ncbi:DNA-directed RNA polymerase I subunit RPA43 [Betta splendens]|uniref:DNA-directed RNA polymerase subunit n=1 Tax=Betta splendens TaxID=158456 RepID=A0A6P7NYL6_BETSP|nr:DNA-directed RNA polymerase I subunit RPA43 [Betta splendens]